MEPNGFSGLRNPTKCATSNDIVPPAGAAAGSREDQSQLRGNFRTSLQKRGGISRVWTIDWTWRYAAIIYLSVTAAYKPPLHPTALYSAISEIRHRLTQLPQTASPYSFPERSSVSRDHLPRATFIAAIVSSLRAGRLS
jgi:hypothetical protein